MALSNLSANPREQEHNIHKLDVGKIHYQGFPKAHRSHQQCYIAFMVL